MGRVHYARVYGQKYVDIFAGRWRIAKSRDPRTSLDSVDGINEGFMQFSNWQLLANSVSNIYIENYVFF